METELGKLVVNGWDAIVAFGGLMVAILFAYWAVAWAHGLTVEQNLRADDLDDFSAMDLSRDERHAVAEILQARMGR
jgi:hypothetical protein